MSQDSTISGLPTASTLTGNEIVPIDQGATKQTTASQIAALSNPTITAAVAAEAAIRSAADTAITTNLSASSGSSLVGFIQSGTGTIAETDQTALRRIIYLDQYGFLTSNSAATNVANLLACIAQFGSATYRIGLGTYPITDIPLVLAGGTSGFIIEGQHRYGTILSYTGSGTGIAKSTQATSSDGGVVIRDLQIVNAGSGAVGIDYTSIWYSDITRCTITGFTKQILLSKGSGNGTYDNRITDNVLTGGTHGVHVSSAGGGGGSSNLHYIARNQITNMTTYGVRVDAGLIANTIDNNDIETAGALTAFVSNAGTNTTIRNNWFDSQNAGNTGLDFGGITSWAYGNEYAGTFGTKLSNTGTGNFQWEQIDVIVGSITLAFGGSSTGITYSTHSIRYQRTPYNTWRFDARLTLTSKGAQVGTATITLPFATNASAIASAITITPVTLAAAAITQITAIIGAGTSTINLSRYAAGTSTAMADTDFTNTSDLIFSGEVEL